MKEEIKRLSESMRGGGFYEIYKYLKAASQGGESKAKINETVNLLIEEEIKKGRGSNAYFLTKLANKSKKKYGISIETKLGQSKEKIFENLTSSLKDKDSHVFKWWEKLAKTLKMELTPELKEKARERLKKEINGGSTYCVHLLIELSENHGIDLGEDWLRKLFLARIKKEYDKKSIHEFSLWVRHAIGDCGLELKHIPYFEKNWKKMVQEEISNGDSVYIESLDETAKRLEMRMDLKKFGVKYLNRIGREIEEGNIYEALHWIEFVKKRAGMDLKEIPDLESKLPRMFRKAIKKTKIDGIGKLDRLARELGFDLGEDLLQKNYLRAAREEITSGRIEDLSRIANKLMGKVDIRAFGREYHKRMGREIEEGNTGTAILLENIANEQGIKLYPEEAARNIKKVPKLSEEKFNVRGFDIRRHGDLDSFKELVSKIPDSKDSEEFEGCKEVVFKKVIHHVPEENLEELWGKYKNGEISEGSYLISYVPKIGDKQGAGPGGGFMYLTRHGPYEICLLPQKEKEIEETMRTVGKKFNVGGLKRVLLPPEGVAKGVTLFGKEGAINHDDILRGINFVMDAIEIRKERKSRKRFRKV